MPKKISFSAEDTRRIRDIVATKSIAQAAKEMRISVQAMRRFCYKQGFYISKDSPQRKYQVIVNIPTAAAILAAANVRDIVPNELVTRLLETLAEDKLFDAVLADSVFENKTVKNTVAR